MKMRPPWKKCLVLV